MTLPASSSIVVLILLAASCGANSVLSVQPRTDGAAGSNLDGGARAGSAGVAAARAQAAPLRPPSLEQTALPAPAP
jgi:hypothetical protein